MTRDASASEIEKVSERVAQLTAHRACHAAEHDPLNGRIHGYCIVCGVPWPCEYAGTAPPTDAWAIIRALAGIYTVDTDQVALIGLVQRAKAALLTTREAHPQPDAGLPHPQQEKAGESLDEMRRASDLVDEACGLSEYQPRLIALALIAREYLRRISSADVLLRGEGGGQMQEIQTDQESRVDHTQYPSKPLATAANNQMIQAGTTQAATVRVQIDPSEAQRVSNRLRERMWIQEINDPTDPDYQKRTRQLLEQLDVYRPHAEDPFVPILLVSFAELGTLCDAVDPHLAARGTDARPRAPESSPPSPSPVTPHHGSTVVIRSDYPDDWQVWIGLPDDPNGPPPAGYSFVIGSGETRGAAIAAAIADIRGVLAKLVPSSPTSTPDQGKGS